MPPLRGAVHLASRPASEPIQMAVTGGEKRQCSRAGYARPSPSQSSFGRLSSGPATFARESEDAEQGADEIRRILQQSSLACTPRTFLGVSPPTRTAGAMNPLVQDWAWKSNVLQCSHSNLQALREMDARGKSFLRSDSQTGDCRLLYESPEYGVLDSGVACAPPRSPLPWGNRSCSGSSSRSRASPISCQTGFSVA